MHEFFNSRFGHGRVLCEIARVARRFVDVEVFVSEADLPHLTACPNTVGLEPQDLRLALGSPGQGFLAEYMPVFGISDSGAPVGIVFDCPRLDGHADFRRFANHFLERAGIQGIVLPEGFSTAGIAVDEDVVLVSRGFAPRGDADPNVQFLRERCPRQSFHVVMPLPIEVGDNLEMFLWPVGPATWIGSEYPSGSPEAEAMAPILRQLREHGHTVHPVPGLAPLIFDDVKTTPRYANGMILNAAVLLPVYGRPEDAVAKELLNRLGFEVYPIDCSDVILSGGAPHCMATVLPTSHSSMEQPTRGE